MQKLKPIPRFKNEKDVAYQSLMKLFLDDRVSQELHKAL